MATLNYKGTTFQANVEGLGLATVESIRPLGRNWFEATLKGGGTIEIQLSHETWLRVSNPNREKLMAAEQAVKELAAARKKYRETMKELGAVQKGRGSWEDYEKFLEIPDIPGIEWENA